MKLIFYKGFKGNLLDKLICLWTFGPFSHVEFVIEDVDSHWLAYSSSPRENKTRYKKIEKSNKWVEVDIDFLNLNKNMVVSICRNELNKKYDYISIFFTFVLPLNIQSKKKWFCSEICAYIINKSGYDLNKPPHQVHPNKLYKMITKLSKIRMENNGQEME